MDSAEFPRLLDAQYAGYSEDIPFWMALARRQGGPVLELGCGTGRVMRALIGQGYEAVGLDQDASMLAWARRRLPSSGAGRFGLVHGDLRSFKLGRAFPLVIIPCNTFAGLDTGEAKSALGCVHCHLNPHGLLAIDMPNPTTALLAEEPDGEPLAEFIEPESGNPVQVFADERPLSREEQIRVIWAYHELLPDGTRRILEVQTGYHLRGRETAETLLAQCGFPIVDFYGDYDFGAYGSTSDRLLVVAEKR
jgi:SAM-dependent methyltransferase